MITYLYTTAYYYLRPFISRRLQIACRRRAVSAKRSQCRDIWPIDDLASRIPPEWKGWPEDKEFVLVLTHDVDTASGQGKCVRLAELERSLGFRSSFYFVPERYEVDPELREFLVESGFEVGVHDLNHDGKLYNSRKVFDRRARRINNYLQEWNSTGFRSGSMHKNLDWIHELDVEYDMSTYDTDPFEPWSMAVRTIFPFLVKDGPGSGYIELPYTLSQDFTLFVLMGETTIDIWKKKIDWIADRGGMALLITHPDYTNFNHTELGPEEYPVDYYSQLLEYINSRYRDRYWSALPGEVARYWKEEVLGISGSEARLHLNREVVS